MRNAWWISEFVGARSVVGAACLVAVASCSGPEESTHAADPVAEVQEEFSGFGVDRLIPIRIVQWKQLATDPDNLNMDQITKSVNAANYVYRDVGLQFYVNSIESYVSDFGTSPARGFYDVDFAEAATQYFTWAQVRNSLTAALPNMPANAYLDQDQSTIFYWLEIASASVYASYEEILVWVVANGGTGGAATGPGRGRTMVMRPGGFNEKDFSHELGHFLGLLHTFDTIAGVTDPETGGTFVTEDLWDLIYGPAPASNPGSPTLFASKAEALAYTGTKLLRNGLINGVDNCVSGLAPQCSMTCQMYLSNNTLTSYTDSPAIDGSLRFKRAADNPPTSYKRGVNSMTYLGQPECVNNGITAAQAQVIRKTMKYNQVQGPQWEGNAYIGTPNSTHRELLGYRRAEPAQKVDFDGDGKRDVAMFRPPSSVGGTGQFRIRFSSQSWGTTNTVSFGKPGDVPVPADYDGDGRTDIAVVRTSGPNGSDPTDGSAYWIYCPSNGGMPSCANPVTIAFGARRHFPIVGTDFDGNPATGEMAIYTPRLERVSWRTGPSFNSTQFRQFTNEYAGGAPLMMQLDSDSKTDMVQYRPSANAAFTMRLSSNNWDTEIVRTFSNTAPGSYPVRTTSTGKDVLSVYDPATSTFRTMWTPLTSNTITNCTYGGFGDAAVGTNLDLDGDQKSDRVLFRAPNSVGDLRLTVLGSSACSGPLTQQSLGPANSTRMVTFMGQDASGDGKPDLWTLDTYTMTWKFLFSQFLPATWTWGTVTVGESTDVPL